MDPRRDIDCLILHPVQRAGYYPVFGRLNFIWILPQGLWTLAGRLAQAGRSVRIVHLGVCHRDSTPEAVRRALARYRPRVVAIALHWHHQTHDALLAAEEVRRLDPGIFVVMGGITASTFAEDLVREHPSVDLVIQGDAEEPIVEVVEAVALGRGDVRSAANAVCRGPGGEAVRSPRTYVARDGDLTALDTIDFGLLDDFPAYRDRCSNPWWVPASPLGRLALDQIVGGRRFFPIPVARGCVHSCLFCGGRASHLARVYSRRGVLHFPLEQVLANARAAREAGFDQLYVDFVEPMGATRRDHYVELLRGLRDLAPAHVQLDCRTLPGPEVLEAVRSLPRATVIVSIESVEQVVRGRLQGKKCIGDEDLYAFLRATRDAGIPVEIFLGLGYFEGDGDPREPLRRFLRELPREFPHARVVTNLIEIEPGSSHQQEAERHGYVAARRTLADYRRAAGSSKPPVNYRLGYAPRRLYDEAVARGAADPVAEAVAEYERFWGEFYCRHLCLVSPQAGPLLNAAARAGCRLAEAVHPP